MYMGRSLHIYIEHRNLEIRKTCNDFFVQVRTFLLPLSVKVLRHQERGTLFLFWLFHLPTPNTYRTRYKGLREQVKVNRLVRCLVSTKWLFKNLPKSSALFWCVTSPAFRNPASNVGYYDISEWHVRSTRARANTCVNVAPK